MPSDVVTAPALAPSTLVVLGGPGASSCRPSTVELPAAGPEAAADPYERLLLDALAGDPTLFTRSDEIEQQWRICDPAAAELLTAGDAWRAL